MERKASEQRRMAPQWSGTASDGSAVERKASEQRWTAPQWSGTASDGSAVERKASEQRWTSPQWSGRRPNYVGRLRSGAEGVRTAYTKTRQSRAHVADALANN